MYVVYINLLYFLSIFLFTYNKNLSQKKSTFVDISSMFHEKYSYTSVLCCKWSRHEYQPGQPEQARTWTWTCQYQPGQPGHTRIWAWTCQDLDLDMPGPGSGHAMTWIWTCYAWIWICQDLDLDMLISTRTTWECQELDLDKPVSTRTTWTY